MPNFKELLKVCRKTSTLTERVIDDFLIFHAAERDKLDRKAEKELARYRHITKQLPGWKEYCILQYIGHRIFKEGGLIKKYIRHSALQILTEEEMGFLEYQKKHPWRFSYSKIVGRPKPDFFEMQDVFTGESYLLYSPGLHDMLNMQTASLCFNLIYDNGKCMQCYGPIGAYTAFEPHDIFFYSTQINNGKRFETGRELMENVERNPVSYTQLFYGSIAPSAYYFDDKIEQIAAEYLDDSFDADVFKDQFTVEYNNGVYKISDEGWDEFPHFCTAYYDEGEELLYLYSMTERSFRYLIRQLNACGYEFSFDPDWRVSMAMLITVSDVLKKEVNLDPYYHLFEKDLTDEDYPEMEEMNAFFSALLNSVDNLNQEDLEQLAVEYNVPLKTVKEMKAELKRRIDEMTGYYDKQ